jgi:O-antigen/teichoic acid export membrane protein
MRMVAIDNALRPVEPLLVLACASFYAGGGWGSFKLAESMAYLLFRLSLLGLDRGIVWRFGHSEPVEYRRDLFASLAWVLGASLIGSIALIGLSFTAVGSVKGMDLPLVSLLMIAASIPLLAGAEMLFQANLNHQEMLARILGKNVVMPLVTFGGAALSHFLHGPGLPFWFFLGTLANGVVAIVAFLRTHGISRSDLKPSKPSRDLLNFSFPLIGSDLLAGVTSRMDLMLLGGLAGIKAVEVYNVVMMIGRSLNAIRSSFEGLLLSAFSREGNKVLTSLLRIRLNHAVWAVGNLMGLALLVIVFWGQNLLSLLNPQYQEGWTALIAMTFLTWLNVSGDLSGLMLQGLGRSRDWMSAQVAGFVVNLAFNLWWIPLWGALGGVLALGASVFAQGLVCQLLLWRSIEGHIWIGRYLRSSLHFGSGLVALCAISLFLDNIWLRSALFAFASASWVFLYRKGSADFGRDLVPATQA